jgi:hypothetical protein
MVMVRVIIIVVGALRTVGVIIIMVVIIMVGMFPIMLRRVMIMVSA